MEVKSDQCGKCPYFRKPGFGDPMECRHPHFNGKEAYAGCIIRWDHDKDGNAHRVAEQCPLLKKKEATHGNSEDS